jgi:hypothetical protein
MHRIGERRDQALRFGGLDQHVADFAARLYRKRWRRHAFVQAESLP